ncbi:23S rRNA (guanosine(2251)-2'-O)-methyltransferase RlmB [Saccharospirillum sp. MSK14-1]|uniref:23S rRNA (guanosine(2251)-2'-O)-methyltransferase RlmB n=1 Tax=Saccharospirillum sp. MSK14-1 TaxID=1897632 RepID=UPI000D348084|nr:23S rRNA (guanosine(2251)-2'-O)-methyltransferase RlmB [Saccharospirillum sp. MSK14-1]PTY35928.1 23S rRNA (guanosine(2251)-2'-O)-methyltransferase RlmB [Saccharospirillum sp. MSK14-1]
MSDVQWIYGLHACQSALENQADRVRELVLLKGRQDKRIQAVLDQARNSGVKFRWLERDAFERLVHQQQLGDARHQGVLIQMLAAPVLDEAGLDALLDGLDRPALLLVLDGVTDPHNIGACLRSADAAGADAVIVPKDKSASLTPTAVKIASGAADTVPFVVVTNLARTLEQMKGRGIWIYGAAGEAKASLYQSDFTASVALVLGAEGKGLRRLTRDTCDGLFMIPMAGQVSSLNVSVAAGISLFEVVRQRLSG